MIFFQDNFGAVGAVNGRTPDVGTLAWVSPQPGQPEALVMSSGAAVNETPTDLFAAGVALYGSGANLTANQNTKITLVFSSPVDWLPGSDSEKGILLHLNSSAVSYGSVGAGEVIVKVGAIYDFGTSFGVRFDSQAYNQQSSGIPEDWFEGGVDFTLVYEVAAGQVTITVNQVGANPALVPKVLNFPESNVPGLSAVTSIGVGVGGGYKLLSIQAEGAAGGGGAASTADLTAPSPTLSSTGRSSAGENDFTYTAPSALLSARGGVNARLASPSPTLTTTATFTNWGKASISAPSATLSASGTVSGTGQAALTFSTPYKLVGYSGAVASITLTGKYTVQATSTAGSIGGAAITCPLFELTSTATAQNYGSANLLAPAARLGAQAQAWLVAPGFTLTAIGSATIMATYEAYAVNLGHRKPNATDETTRYTNFPFDHVVRYQNSYYGANSTGLYLLEGTTDDGAPIPWAIKTAITDFDSTREKTVASVYLSGRLGPEATITLQPGEDAANTYSFTTPRAATIRNHRQKMGRGLDARYFALGVSGDDTMELDGIEFNVQQKTRRI